MFLHETGLEEGAELFTKVLDGEVYFRDSLLYRECSGRLDTSKVVFRRDYDSLDLGLKNELEVRLAFYCDGREIELPTDPEVLKIVDENWEE